MKPENAKQKETAIIFANYMDFLDTGNITSEDCMEFCQILREYAKGNFEAPVTGVAMSLWMPRIKREMQGRHEAYKAKCEALRKNAIKGGQATKKKALQARKGQMPLLLPVIEGQTPNGQTPQVAETPLLQEVIEAKSPEPPSKNPLLQEVIEGKRPNAPISQATKSPLLQEVIEGQKASTPYIQAKQEGKRPNASGCPPLLQEVIEGQISQVVETPLLQEVIEAKSPEPPSKNPLLQEVIEGQMPNGQISQASATPLLSPIIDLEKRPFGGHLALFGLPPYPLIINFLKKTSCQKKPNLEGGDFLEFFMIFKIACRIGLPPCLSAHDVSMWRWRMTNKNVFEKLPQIQELAARHEKKEFGFSNCVFDEKISEMLPPLDVAELSPLMSRKVWKFFEALDKMAADFAGRLGGYENVILNFAAEYYRSFEREGEGMLPVLFAKIGYVNSGRKIYNLTKFLQMRKNDEL